MSDADVAMLMFSRLREALGLFDGAATYTPSDLWEQEVLPTLEALKRNNPEAAIVIQENQRTHRLWRDALRRLSQTAKALEEAHQRRESAITRWQECDDARRALLSQMPDRRLCGSCRYFTSENPYGQQVRPVANYCEKLPSIRQNSQFGPKFGCVLHEPRLEQS